MLYLVEYQLLIQKGSQLALLRWKKWRRWKRAFELFVVGKGVTDNTQKRALLLHCAGIDVQDIFDTSDTGEL